MLVLIYEYEMNGSIMVAEYSRENHSANQITVSDFSAAVDYLLVSEVRQKSS